MSSSVNIESKINSLAPITGRCVKEDSTTVNLADMIEAIYSKMVVGTLPVNASLIGSLANLPTVTIANGANISEVIDLSSQSLIALSMPAAWTAASITFAVSLDNVTFNPLYYQGAEFTLSEAAASRQITIDPTALIAWRYIKVRSGTNATPVNQGQVTTIQLLTKPIA